MKLLQQLTLGHRRAPTGHDQPRGRVRRALDHQRQRPPSICETDEQEAPAPRCSRMRITNNDIVVARQLPRLLRRGSFARRACQAQHQWREADGSRRAPCTRSTCHRRRTQCDRRAAPRRQSRPTAPAARRGNPVRVRPAVERIQAARGRSRHRACRWSTCSLAAWALAASVGWAAGGCTSRRMRCACMRVAWWWVAPWGGPVSFGDRPQNAVALVKPADVAGADYAVVVKKFCSTRPPSASCWRW